MEISLTVALGAVAVAVVVVFAAFKFVVGKFTVVVKYPVPSPNGAVVVTGAASGIGFAAAAHLAAQGHTVYAGFRSVDDSRIPGLREAATKAGARASSIVPVAIDVTDQRSVDAAAATVAAAVGDAGVVGLVNSAGCNVGPYPVEFVQLEKLSEQLEVNVTGQVRVVQAFLPLVRQATGRIVFMSSVAGKIAGNFQGPYAASKHAIEAISDSLRRELSPWRISVSNIIAAEISTPLLSTYDKEAAQAKSTLASVDAKAVEYYGMYYDNYKPTHPKFVGTVEQTNRAIEHALTAPTPKTRYTVASKPMLKGHLYPSVFLGFPSWSIVPDRFLDKSMARSQWPRRLLVSKK